MNYFQAFKLSIPVLLGYVPAGFAFGILALKIDMPWYLILSMSLFIYAGAGQFLLISLFSSLAGYLEIAIASFLLNLRHSFYGLSLIKPYANTGLVKPYLIFGMTDETYALIQTMPELEREKKKKIYLFINLLNHFYWLFGTALGIFIGENLKINYKGIEFALTALFVVLSIEMYKKNPKLKLLVLAFAISVLVLLLLPTPWFLVSSLSLSLLYLILLKGFFDG